MTEKVKTMKEKYTENKGKKVKEEPETVRDEKKMIIKF